MVMLLNCGMSLKDIAECFTLEVKTVERLIVEYQRDSSVPTNGRLGFPSLNSSAPAMTSESTESTTCAVFVSAFPAIMSCRVRRETKAHRRNGLEIC